MKKRYIVGLSATGFVIGLLGFEGFARLTPGIPTIEELFVRGATTSNERARVMPSLRYSPAVASFAVRDYRGVRPNDDDHAAEKIKTGSSGLPGKNSADSGNNGIGNTEQPRSGTGTAMVADALVGSAVSVGVTGNTAGNAPVRRKTAGTRRNPIKKVSPPKPKKAVKASIHNMERPARRSRSKAEENALIAKQREAYAEANRPKITPKPKPAPAPSVSQKKYWSEDLMAGDKKLCIRPWCPSPQKQEARQRRREEHEKAEAARLAKYNAYMKRKAAREAAETKRKAAREDWLKRKSAREAAEMKRKAARADWLKRKAAKEAADKAAAQAKVEQLKKDHTWCSKLNNRYEAVNKPGCVALGYNAKRPVKKKAAKPHTRKKNKKKNKTTISQYELDRRYCRQLKAAWKNAVCHNQFGYKKKAKPAKKRTRYANRITKRPEKQKQKMSDRAWCKHIGYSSKACTRFKPRKHVKPKKKHAQMRMFASRSAADKAAEHKAMMTAKCRYDPAAQGCKAFVGNPWKDGKK